MDGVDVLAGLVGDQTADTISLANEWLGDLPPEVQHKITVGNACRVYDFTPADPATIVRAGVR